MMAEVYQLSHTGREIDRILSDAKTVVGNLDNRFRPIDGNFSPEFEIGTISISNNTLVYLDSAKQIRTKEGSIYAVPEGTSFALRDYTNGGTDTLRMMVYYSYDAGKTYAYFECTTANPVFVAALDAVVAVKIISTKAQTDISLAKLLAVDVQTAVKELRDKIGGPFFAEYSTAVSTTSVNTYWNFADNLIENGKQYIFKIENYTGQYLKGIKLYLYNSNTDNTVIQENLLPGHAVTFNGNSAYKYLRVVATVSQMEANAEILTVSLRESDSESLYDKVKALEASVAIKKTAPNVLILGDSYSAMGRWIEQLKSFISLGEVVNLGVSSATLKDKETDRTTYPYTDNPVKTNNTYNNNTFGCQIEKLKRLMLGEVLYDGETKLDESKYPEIILVEGGTNDLVDASTDGYVSQIYTVEQGYIASRFDTSVKSGSIKIPTPYDQTDRTTFAGAMRYLYGFLHDTFPHVPIFFITPCGLHYMSGQTHKYLEKGEQIKYAASLLSIPVIDWGVNGRLSVCDNVVTGTGTEDDPYIYDAAGDYSSDSLHPNADGAQLLAAEVAKVLNGYNLARYVL